MTRLFSLPTRFDWAWVLGLVLLGGLLGLGLNACTGHGINMTIALGLDEPAATAPVQAQP